MRERGRGLRSDIARQGHTDPLQAEAGSLQPPETAKHEAGKILSGSGYDFPCGGLGLGIGN